MAFPDGWLSSALLTIDKDKVFGSSNFSNMVIPCTVDNLPSEMFDADGDHPALSGGGDIAFSTDAAGTNRIACAVSFFTINNNPALGTALIFLIVPTTTFATDTELTIWWEKAGETQPAIGDAFGRHATFVDLEFFLPLDTVGADATPGEYPDWAGNGYSGRGGSGNPAKVPGSSTVDNLYGAVWADINGTDQWIDIPSSGSSNFNNSPGYISAQVVMDVLTSTNECIISNHKNFQDSNLCTLSIETDGLKNSIKNVSGDLLNFTEAGTISTGSLIFTGSSWSNARVTSYLNGLQVSEDTSSSDGQFSTLQTFTIGSFFDFTSGRTIDGRIGMVSGRIYQPTDDQIKTEHAAWSDPGTYMSAGAREGVGGGVPRAYYDMLLAG